MVNFPDILDQNEDSFLKDTSNTGIDEYFLVNEGFSGSGEDGSGSGSGMGYDTDRSNSGSG